MNTLFKVKLKSNIVFIDSSTDLEHNKIYNVIHKYQKLSNYYPDMVRDFVILKEDSLNIYTLDAFDIIIDDDKGERAPITTDRLTSVISQGTLCIKTPNHIF